MKKETKCKNKWNDKPTSFIHKSINSYHLIIFPFCENYRWYTFMFIRLDKKKYILIQFDSLKKEGRIKESKELIKWFKSSTFAQKHRLIVLAFYPTAYLNQKDGYSYGLFVCIHAFNASVLS